MCDELFVMTANADGIWHHSKFPHPLITVDYDANDKVIQVVALGPPAERLVETLWQTIAAASSREGRAKHA